MTFLYIADVIFCLVCLWFVRRRPIWIQLILGLVLTLLCPVLLIGRGGAELGPTIYFLAFHLTDLKHNDFLSLGIQISWIWIPTCIVWMAIVGISRLSRKVK